MSPRPRIARRLAERAARSGSHWTKPSRCQSGSARSATVPFGSPLRPPSGRYSRSRQTGMRYAQRVHVPCAPPRERRDSGHAGGVRGGAAPGCNTRTPAVRCGAADPARRAVRSLEKDGQWSMIAWCRLRGRAFRADRMLSVTVTDDDFDGLAGFYEQVTGHRSPVAGQRPRREPRDRQHRDRRDARGCARPPDEPLRVHRVRCR